MNRFVRSRALGWSAVLLLLVIWQVASTLEPSPELPSLDRIAAEWWHQVTQGSLLTAVGQTLSITLIGFAIAAIVGGTLGFVMGRVRPVWALLEPGVELVRQTPLTALFPLLILYLGVGDQLKIVVVLLAALFPVLLNAYAGARTVPATMRLTARTFSLSWLETQWEVALPAALPSILTGMRQALSIALVMAVLAGMLAGNTGIGYYLLQAQQALNVTALYAGILTIAAVGYGLNLVFLLISNQLTRWQRRTSDR